MLKELSRQTKRLRPLWKRSEAPWAGLALLLLFHLCANVWWLAADNHPIRTDEETHMLMARTYYEAMFLSQNGPQSLLDRIIAVSRIEPGNPAHPPLLHIAGAVMVALFGYSPEVLAGTNTVMFLLTLLGCFLIARQFLGPWPSLFSTFVVSFTPITFAASRYFMTDYVSMALVVWCVYALIRSDRFLDTPWVFVFAILNGLGFLARITTFLYYAVPCALVLYQGGRAALRRDDKRLPGWAMLRRWAFNVTLTAVVSTGLFGPWYFRHVERFSTYWIEEHRPGSGGPLALAESGDGQLVAPAGQKKGQEEAKAKPAAAAPAVPARQGLIPKLLAQVVRPTVPWKRYPLFVLNNGTFMALFLAGLWGVTVPLRRREYRNLTVASLLLWLMGSWVLLTLLMSFSTARYALQAIPAFSMLAALAVLSIRAPRERRVVMWALSGALLFQYGNLTVHAYGPLAQVRLPLLPDAKMQLEYDDPGLYIYKERLTLGFSYARLSAPVHENFKDRIFLALLRAEKNRPLRQGEHANYLRLNMRGMVFDEQHYWPDGAKPNPYRRQDIPPDLMPVRRLRSVGWGSTPKDIATLLNVADYVVYSIEANRTEEEADWQAFLTRNNYELVDRFQTERFGRVPARSYAVFSKRQEGTIVAIQSREDINKLSLYEIYGFKNSSEFLRAPESVQAYVKDRFNQMAAVSGKAHSINQYVSFITAAVNHERGAWYKFQFVFRVDKALPDNYRIFFHGKPADMDISYLPMDKRAQGYVDWNFDPTPPTLEWPVGEYIIISHRINAERIPLWLKLGFFSRKEGYWGNSVQLGWVDFSKIQDQGPAAAPEVPPESKP
jgi:4-amino-4-deoxy-L-arabinose transferase-like glycosyltransferase